MSVGIYDADIAKYLLVPFNLDAMKVSAYYKKKREMVLLAKEFDPDRNKQFFYFKDWDDGDFPLDIHKENTTFRGHAFSGPAYVPMDEQIEKMKPDTSIYGIMADLIGTNARNKRVFNDMTKAEHCRLSLDGKTVWPQYMSQFKDLSKTKLIMIHDYDLSKVNGAFEAVQEILKHTTRNPAIGLKFAPQLTNAADLMKWSSLHASDIFYSMGYNGLMPMDDFKSWCAQSYGKTSYASLEYDIMPASFCQNDFTEDFLRQILRQVIISRSYRLKITLIYSDDFFVEEKPKQLLNLFNFYQHSMLSAFTDAHYIKQVQHDTLFDFAKASLDEYGKYPQMLNRWDMRGLFHWVQEKYPTLFKEFYELSYNQLKEEMK